jgi:hypothetical protein
LNITGYESFLSGYTFLSSFSSYFLVILKETKTLFMIRSILVIAVAAALASAGCKKGETGGDATLGITAKHHGVIIPGTTIYIKYDAEDFPGEDITQYDASVTANASGYAEIPNLRYGNYYIYGVGYDSALQETVKGGAPIKIKWSDRKDTQKEDLSITE